MILEFNFKEANKNQKKNLISQKNDTVINEING